MLHANLKEVKCKQDKCEYFYNDGKRKYCTANRKLRRKIKCYINWGEVSGK